MARQAHNQPHILTPYRDLQRSTEGAEDALTILLGIVVLTLAAGWIWLA